MDVKTIQQAVEQIIAGTGIYLVRAAVLPKQRIAVQIDRDPAIGIDECVDVNRKLVSMLAPEIEDYDLEVSSPGLTEPFLITRQYIKHVGEEINVLRQDGTRCKGLLIEADDRHIILRTVKTVKDPATKKKSEAAVDTDIPREDIKSAKLIITFK